MLTAKEIEAVEKFHKEIQQKVGDEGQETCQIIIDLCDELKQARKSLERQIVWLNSLHTIQNAANFCSKVDAEIFFISRLLNQP